MKQKIERIILFGDSFVEGQGIYDPDLSIQDNPCGEPFTPEQHSELRHWRKKNSWRKYLKKHFPNVQIKNYASQGCGNYEQFYELNNIISTLTDTDLVLFGFTSKYRDSITSMMMGFQHHGGVHIQRLLHPSNPLLTTPVAFERISVEDKFSIDGSTHEFFNEKEKEFTYNFLKKWLVYTFDEVGYERTAQTNYMFYSDYAKMKGFNIHFFDLFEPYVTPKFNDKLDIDTNVYLTYGEEDLHTYVDRYERENGTYNDEVSYWECGHTQPIPDGRIYHPNQHGYELWIDYMYDRWLSKWYE